MASHKEGTSSLPPLPTPPPSQLGKTKAKVALGCVQIDGLVILKVIKHYQEEGQGTEIVQGVLWGLVVEDRLEIISCFPQRAEDGVTSMKFSIRRKRCAGTRQVNFDHLLLGGKQPTYDGPFVTRVLLDSQFSYQHAIEESVVLVYNPMKTAQRQLEVKI